MQALTQEWVDRAEEDGTDFPRTRDLTLLLDLLLPRYPLWAALRPALLQLKDYAVDFRYPGETADKDEAREAVRLRRSVREAVPLSLSLPPS